MLKIKTIDWMTLKQDDKYIFINPYFIMYIMPYSNEQENLYTLTMFNSESFMIDQNNLEKIVKYKNNEQITKEEFLDNLPKT